MPRLTGSARRYADAAFAIAERDGNVRAWLTHLERAAALVSDEKAENLLDNPALPLDKRRELLEAAIGKDAPPALLNLLLLLLRRGRIELVPRIAIALRELVDRKSGIRRAVVTSASELSAQEVRALEERLERDTGGKVELQVKVDPSLLGGLVVRVGDRLLDGSVRGRLERLRDQVASGAIS
jgi:F-type H+-transporting ATPase subunit delta